MGVFSFIHSLYRLSAFEELIENRLFAFQCSHMEAHDIYLSMRLKSSDHAFMFLVPSFGGDERKTEGTEACGEHWEAASAQLAMHGLFKSLGRVSARY